MKRLAPPLYHLQVLPLILYSYCFSGPDSGKWEQRGNERTQDSVITCLVFWLARSKIFLSHIPVKPLFKTSGPKGGSCSTVRGLVISKFTFLFPGRATIIIDNWRPTQPSLKQPTFWSFRTGTPLTNLLTLLYLQQPDSIGFSFTDGSSKALLLLHFLPLRCVTLRYAALRYSPLRLCKQSCSSLPLYGPFWPLLALA